MVWSQKIFFSPDNFSDYLIIFVIQEKMQSADVDACC